MTNYVTTHTTNTQKRKRFAKYFGTAP